MPTMQPNRKGRDVSNEDNKRHTPGPWHWVDSVDDKPYVFGGSNNGWPSLRTVDVFGENKTVNNDGKSYTSFALPKFILDVDGQMANEADARLIAAAPQLVDGINALLGLLQLLEHNPLTHPEIVQAMRNSHRVQEAKDAIATAGVHP